MVPSTLGIGDVWRDCQMFGSGLILTTCAYFSFCRRFGSCASPDLFYNADGSRRPAAWGRVRPEYCPLSKTYPHNQCVERNSSKSCERGESTTAPQILSDLPPQLLSVQQCGLMGVKCDPSPQRTRSVGRVLQIAFGVNRPGVKRHLQMQLLTSPFFEETFDNLLSRSFVSSACFWKEYTKGIGLHLSSDSLHVLCFWNHYSHWSNGSSKPEQCLTMGFCVG